MFGPERYAKIVQERLQQDLHPEDREVLHAAGLRRMLWSYLGPPVGASLGLYTAFRLRSTRRGLFTAAQAWERPTHVVFPSGRVDPIPDPTRFLKRNPLGDIAACLFASLGGSYVGGKLGRIVGNAHRDRFLEKDPESRDRMKNSSKRLRVALLREQADALEKTIPNNAEEDQW